MPDSENSHLLPKPKVKEAVDEPEDKPIFLFVWMGVLLLYTTISAIIGSVKWMLVSSIACDFFTILTALLWIFVAIDFSLNMNWIIDKNPKDEEKEDFKIRIKSYSRYIRIAFVWIVVNILLPLKAFDTLPSNQQLWDSHNNISVSLDTGLFFGSCIMYVIITVLLCIILGAKLYNLFLDPNSANISKTTVTVGIWLYCIMMFMENFLRNMLMINWFSCTNKSNSLHPLLVGLLIPVSASIMLSTFMIDLIVEGLHKIIKQEKKDETKDICCLIVLVYLQLFSILSVPLFYSTIFFTMPVYYASATTRIFFTFSILCTIIFTILSCCLYCFMGSKVKDADFAETKV